MSRFLTARAWAMTGVIGAAVAGGCAHCDDCGTSLFSKHNAKKARVHQYDLPAGAIPQPAGTYTREFLSRQALRAEVDDFVVYRYEWADDSEKLNDYGDRHTAQMARRMTEVPAMAVIEDCGKAELNEARRATLIGRLISAGLADAPNRVYVSTAEAEGLYGEEMPRVYNRLLGGGGIGGGQGGGGQGGGGGGVNGFGSGLLGGLGGGGGGGFGGGLFGR